MMLKMIDNAVGTLWIVAAPSGGGKTSLVRALIQSLEGIVVSTSHTTRAPRPGEVDGADYFFVDDATFSRMVAEDAFVEHARVFQRAYGTSRAQIEARLRAGIDVVLDIDWQGAAQIKRLFANALSVFVLPPSLDTLRERLLQRQQDTETIIEQRMARARDELSHFHEFDYLIVNDVFEKAADELKTLVCAERLRCARQQVKEQKLLSFLMAAQ